MIQAPCPVKSKVEIILDIGCFNLAPRITIILSIHPLHLTIMIIYIFNLWEFKKGIPIKCCWNARNIFNAKCTIVDLCQFGSGMGGKKKKTWNNQLHWKKRVENSNDLWIGLQWSIKSNWIQHWRVKGVYKYWNCCIFVKRIAKVYECGLVNQRDTVWFIHDMNTMGDDIGNKGNNV